MAGFEHINAYIYEQSPWHVMERLLCTGELQSRPVLIANEHLGAERFVVFSDIKTDKI